MFAFVANTSDGDAVVDAAGAAAAVAVAVAVSGSTTGNPSSTTVSAWTAHALAPQQRGRSRWEEGGETTVLPPLADRDDDASAAGNTDDIDDGDDGDDGDDDDEEEEEEEDNLASIDSR